MQLLIEFLEANPSLVKDDDYCDNGKLKDAIFSRNVNFYLKEWLKANAENLLWKYHNSKSDANPMEEEMEAQYVLGFSEFVKSI